jgi:eukaryotic-like serine/threonine-protein kinase
MSAVTDFLATVDGFNAISQTELDSIVERFEPITFKPDDYLIRRGEQGDSMYVIRSGRVRVPLLDKETGDTKLVVHLGPGDLVGEMALLTGERRSADVIAETVVEVLAINRDTLQPLLRDHPPLARFLTEILGRRLEEGGGIEWVGKYRLLGKIGEGATAKVYQGLHPALNRVVAIKMLSHTLVYDVTFKDRFLQEARTIAGLTHPNIVQIFDTEASYATYFIVMEKVSGTDLARLLKARKVLAPEEAMEILRQMAAALRYAHGQGIVHRDVKPANCAVDEHGVVKLMDFGIARRIQKNPEQKRAKMVEGTPRYLAPEAAVGKPVDGRADIYSLGIMAFEMVTGRVPFYSETIRELLQMHVRRRPPDITRIRSGLPEGLVDFINGALVKRPDERLTDWDRIEELLSDGPVDGEELTDEPMESELVSVRFRSSATEGVSRAVNQFCRRLSAIEGVEVSHARLVPVTASEAQAKLETVAGIPPTLTPGSVGEDEWKAKLAASVRKTKKPAKEPKSTRTMDTLK